MPIVLKISLLLELAFGAWALFAPGKFLHFFNHIRYGKNAPVEIAPHDLRNAQLIGVCIIIVAVYWYRTFGVNHYGWW